jgi:hypothetical protein
MTLREAAPTVVEPNPWKEAVIDRLVVLWSLTDDNEDDPHRALADIERMVEMLALDPAISSDAQALIDRGRAETTVVEPVAWAISYDGKTPYTLWDYGDGALLDLEVKRLGGSACKMAMYTHPPRTALTDEELIGRAKARGIHDADAAVCFGRAIEAAHGIKEQT